MVEYLKILWLSHRDIQSPNSGGAERTIYEIGRRLANSGHEITWRSVKWKGARANLELEKMKIIRAPTNIISHVLNPFTLRMETPDVIVDDLGHAVPWGSELFTKAKGTVFFRHLHKRSLPGQVSLPKRYTIETLESLYSKIYRSWPFVAESNSSIEDLLELGIEIERIQKIPPGVDTVKLKPSKKTDAPTIVYFGGYRAYKRPWEILYAFKEILKENRDAKLYMVGNGPVLDEVKYISNKLGYNKEVVFTGKLDEESLKQIVAKAWVNVHTSVTEGFGYSILEASALGTPTVAYEVNGVKDAIEYNKNGILIKNNERSQLAYSINYEIFPFVEKWSKGSRNVSLKYSWDKSAFQWSEHLGKLVN